MSRAPKQPKPAPALVVEEIGPWGDAPKEDVAGVGSGNDPFYTEGYSDKRQDYDAALAAGERPSPLPYRFQYVSTARASGAPDNSKPAEFAAKGYKVVMYDEAAKYGLVPEKSGFVRAPDGTCRVANQMLMVAPKEVAARHARAQRELTRELSDGATSKLDRAVDEYNAAHGRAPGTPGATSVIREESLHKG